MATAKDYISDDTLDLVISNGDFKKGASDQQASILLMNTNKGSFKFHPFAGMYLKKYLGSTGTEQIIKRDIIVQHRSDDKNGGEGMVVDQCFIRSTDFVNMPIYLNFHRPGFD